MNGEEIFDICIVGGGPAGLSAAINAWVRRKKVVIFSGRKEGAKVNLSPKVDNYLGFPGISGIELYEKFNRHIREFNIPVIHQKVQNIGPLDELFMLLIKDGTMFQCKSIIIATGVTVNDLLDGEEEFVGRGISYCATCDGPLYADKTVTVIDYTGEGAEEAHFMAEFCRKIYYIGMTRSEPQFQHPNVEPVFNDKPIAITGNETVSALKTKERTFQTDGVFIYRETYPPNEIIPGIEVSEGAIKVNRKMETNIPGIYAAGDCAGKPHQVAKSVGEGQTAALNAVAYLDSLK